MQLGKKSHDLLTSILTRSINERLAILEMKEEKKAEIILYSKEELEDFTKFVQAVDKYEFANNGSHNYMNIYQDNNNTDKENVFISTIPNKSKSPFIRVEKNKRITKTRHTEAATTSTYENDVTRSNLQKFTDLYNHKACSKHKTASEY